MAKVLRALAAHAVVAMVGATVQAAPVGYTDRSQFDAAVAGLRCVATTTLNFDGLAAGTLIASGTSVGGITFNYNFGGASLQVSDPYPTTSPPNFLGTDDAGVLQDGDDISLGFGAINAIGLYVMSLDGLFDDDFRLTAGGATVSLSIADLQQTLSDGTGVYFLGLVDATAAFTSSSLRTSQNGTGFFLWNADDIITGKIPEPDTLPLVAASLAALVAVGRRRDRCLQGGARGASS